MDKDTAEKTAAISGILMAITATIIWSWNYIIARGVAENIPPVALSFFRWATAFIFIFPFSFKGLLRERQAVKKNIRYITVMAILSVTLFNTLVYIAGHTTGAINLSLIAISTPVFIILISHFLLKDKTSYKGWAGVTITISGVILLICRGSLKVLFNLSFSSGDLWMTAAAIIFALYSILLKRKSHEIGMLTFLLVTFGIGTAALFPFFIIERAFSPAINFTPSVIISILYTGIFASIAAFFLWNRSVEIIGAAKTGIYYYTLPLFSSLWAFLFLGEEFKPVHLASMLLIISGILIATDIKKTLFR
ncbi:MAG TPA: DMT family transporter [Spirochaetota bacterium]|nr:DMT family transporter [Spirochaetota bacterium]